MKTAVMKFDRWHKTRPGYIVMGFIELILVYILGSLAINSGSILQYFLAFILFIGAVHNFIRTVTNGNK